MHSECVRHSAALRIPQILTCLHLPARDTTSARVELPRYGRLSMRACRFACLSFAAWLDSAGLLDSESDLSALRVLGGGLGLNETIPKRRDSELQKG